jgi:hypothetical protein
MFILVSQINGESNSRSQNMNKTHIAAKSAPTAVPTVKIVRRNVFALKKRAEIAPKDLQKATFISAVNEIPERGEDFNRVVKTVKLEAQDSKGNAFVLTKTYNLLGRGTAAFLDDYNAWSEAGLTEDDLYGNFDGLKDQGTPLVVEVGHRKIGTEWESYIQAFHPAGYTNQPGAEADVTAVAEVETRA